MSRPEYPAVVFCALEPIPDVDALPGDRLLMQPGHPTVPYALVRPLSQDAFVSALAGAVILESCIMPDVAPPSPEKRRWQAPERQRRRHLRQLA